jgi:hypothetical protein
VAPTVSGATCAPTIWSVSVCGQGSWHISHTTPLLVGSMMKPNVAHSTSNCGAMGRRPATRAPRHERLRLLGMTMALAGRSEFKGELALVVRVAVSTDEVVYHPFMNASAASLWPGQRTDQAPRSPPSNSSIFDTEGYIPGTSQMHPGNIPDTSWIHP